MLIPATLTAYISSVDIPICGTASIPYPPSLDNAIRLVFSYQIRSFYSLVISTIMYILKSYMWFYQSSPSQNKKPVIIYDWQPSRRTDHPRDFLKSFSGAIGKALAYSINQEQYLRTFLSDPEFPMDNNIAKQAIRPFTVGRKNFVLIESDCGVKASAVLYSLVETAKANGLNPYKYFEVFLTEIPNHMDEKELGFLSDHLPWSDRIRKECASGKKRS